MPHAAGRHPERGHPGARLRLGRYELVTRIAAGGMAEVFRARVDGSVGAARTVVLKRLLPSFAADSEMVEMFRDEIRIMSRLAHPNIANALDVGSAGGRPYIVMEHVEGISLAQLSTRCAPEPMPVEHALEIALRVGRALTYAHGLRIGGKGAGIIHRDVSPHNVMVSRDGEVKLIDFGIAKAAGQGHRTKSGMLIGRISYMAPERLLGEPYDHRVDIFSLGVVLHEMLTARRLFHRDSDEETMLAVLREELPAPSAVRDGLGTRLDGIVLRALCRDPEGRYGTVLELVTDLEGFRLVEGLPGSPSLLRRYVRSILDESDSDRAGRPAPEHRPDGAAQSVAWHEAPTAQTSVASDASAPPGPPGGPGTPEPWPVNGPVPATRRPAPREMSRAWSATSEEAPTPVVATREPCLAAPSRPEARGGAPAPGAVAAASAGAESPTEDTGIRGAARAVAALVSEPLHLLIAAGLVATVCLCIGSALVLAEPEPGSAAASLGAPAFEAPAHDHAPSEVGARRGMLVVDAPPGCQVFVDGRLVGVTPLAAQALEAGLRNMVVVAPEGQRVRQQVEVRAHEQVRVEVTL